MPSGPADRTLLDVRDLSVTFGTADRTVRAVRGVSFHLRAGECLAVVGESGSGKSVTARALVGLAGPRARTSAAVLRLGDTDLTTLSEGDWRRLRGREVGLVLQAALVALDPLRRVGQEVAEPLRVHRTVPPDRIEARVRELLGSVGVPEPGLRAAQRPGQLSGGLRQRALIASALAAGPGLLIADEPTTALDVTVQAQILDLLATLKADGMGVLLISHDLAVVARLADRIAVMRRGRIVEQGPAAEVLGTPRHPYTRTLLDAVPGGRRRTAPTASADGAVVMRGRDLVKRFQRPAGQGAFTAVDGVSFTLRAGETLGVVGESGSGKTTLARMALGFTAPDQGSVELDGAPWSTLDERHRRALRVRVQTVYQDPLSSFDPRHTVRRLLGHALRAAGEPGGRAGRERVEELLCQVGLDPALGIRRPAELSGGQLQRVAIARALATRPRIVVCDEPVSALDVSVAAQVLGLLNELQAQFGMSYLFISHHLGVIREVSDRVLVMKDGRVVESGAVDTVFDNPRHPYTRALLAAAPRLDGTG
ncbi:ABC transporter ATP-binding protein [Streptomyces sp. NPDC007851]|uniref:ABC transporter ATP-binding protein n=1 Tax=Streptomyces sp. NPDC007851 TaxID=3155008 RepID=UPI0033E21A4B